MFLSGATLCQSHLMQAYCGLVAIELVLKGEVTLTDHNVPAGMDRFKTVKATGQKAYAAFALSSLAAQLRSDIQNMYVQGKNGTSRQAPFDSYPYIRYTRVSGDGWGAPETSVKEIDQIAKTVQRIRNYFKVNFGLAL